MIPKYYEAEAPYKHIIELSSLDMHTNFVLFLRSKLKQIKEVNPDAGLLYEMPHQKRNGRDDSHHHEERPAGYARCLS